MPYVLIVEDRGGSRNLPKVLITVNGYRVTIAGDGLEALDPGRRNLPDAMVSGVLMPNMVGIVLCRLSCFPMMLLIGTRQA